MNSIIYNFFFIQLGFKYLIMSVAVDVFLSMYETQGTARTPTEIKEAATKYYNAHKAKVWICVLEVKKAVVDAATFAAAVVGKGDAGFEEYMKLAVSETENTLLSVAFKLGTFSPKRHGVYIGEVSGMHVYGHWADFAVPLHRGTLSIHFASKIATLISGGKKNSLLSFLEAQGVTLSGSAKKYCQAKGHILVDDKAEADLIIADIKVIFAGMEEQSKASDKKSYRFNSGLLKYFK